MLALPPSEEGDEPALALAEFGDAWLRGEELLSVLSRLPGELVLRSGLSGRRGGLLRRWESLESPGLDGLIPAGGLEAITKWNRDAEALISYIVKIGREYRRSTRAQDDRVYSVPPSNDVRLPEVIDSLEESDFVTDYWCWPWPHPAAPLVKSTKSKWDKGKIVKLGIVAALGAVAVVTYLEEG